MRILVNAVGIRTGGADTFLRNILPKVAITLSDSRFSLVVRDNRVQYLKNLPDNVDVITVKPRELESIKSRLMFEHFSIPYMHYRNHYTLHWQVDEMLSPVITTMGIPSICTYHTTPLVLQMNENSGDSGLFRLYARWIRKHAAKSATFPITVSHHAKAELSGMFPAVKDRLRVIYHGIDDSLFHPKENPVNMVQIPGLKSNYILSVSNRFVWKNYYRLIQAYHQLVEGAAIPYDLVLIGGAKLEEEESRLSHYIHQNKLEERIFLIDYLDQTQLPSLYRGARAYIFPSLRESFGMTVLEAMACGVPVACARWGPLPEVAGDAAVYFDPLDVNDMANAMYRVSTDEGLRQVYSERGLEHIRHFTWDRAAQQYAQIIREARS